MLRTKRTLFWTIQLWVYLCIQIKPFWVCCVNENMKMILISSRFFLIIVFSHFSNIQPFSLVWSISWKLLQLFRRYVQVLINFSEFHDIININMKFYFINNKNKIRLNINIEFLQMLDFEIVIFKTFPIWLKNTLNLDTCMKLLFRSI